MSNLIKKVKFKRS